MRKAAFLDRDGVLNQTVFRMGKPRAPYTPEEFALMDGVPEAIDLLRKNNYLIIVVTNQPDVARGWVSQDAVTMVNEKLKELIHFDDIKICYHTEKDGCPCRKPKPGMLLDAAAKWNIDCSASWMIGDRYSDVEAGSSAGTKTILVGEGDTPGKIFPDHRASSLLEAVEKYLI